jgi:nicotinamidase-related amidase
MSSSTRRSSFDRILVDMNTQCDFLLPNGATPVANRAQILPNIRHLMNWGRLQDLPVVSSLECHRPGEFTNGFPPHCLDYTNGQKKLPFTLMPRRIILHGDNTLDLPLDPFRRYQQLIFSKRQVDFLTNPKADRLVNAVAVGYFIVFGALAEQCIKAGVLGLLTRRHRVVVVTDACGCWCPAEADLAFRQMDAKGAVLVATEELLSGAADTRITAAPLPAPAEEEESLPLAVPSNGRGNGNGKKPPELELPFTAQPAPAKSPTNGKQPAPFTQFIPPHTVAEPVPSRLRGPTTHHGLA